MRTCSKSSTALRFLIRFKSKIMHSKWKNTYVGKNAFGAFLMEPPPFVINLSPHLCILEISCGSLSSRLLDSVSLSRAHRAAQADPGSSPREAPHRLRLVRAERRSAGQPRRDARDSGEAERTLRPSHTDRAADIFLTKKKRKNNLRKGAVVPEKKATC